MYASYYFVNLVNYRFLVYHIKTLFEFIGANKYDLIIIM